LSWLNPDFEPCMLKQKHVFDRHVWHIAQSAKLSRDHLTRAELGLSWSGVG